MKPLIAVALSGGVDSLVAAKLLILQGYPVIGIHFFTGYESADAGISRKQVIARLSSQLEIDVYPIDITQVFKETVVDYFVRTYQSGCTPNPCMVCNMSIKFGTILEFALQKGASFLATGHYARTFSDPDGNIHLLKGMDPVKDQSYFLSRMTHRQISHACFPLGAMVKSEVVRLAGQLGLVPLNHSESQDICFIHGQTYGQFLAGQEGFAAVPGPIVDTTGKLVGKHQGLHLFTVGQRQGINCPAAEPYYVLRIDRDANQLVVGFKSQLLTLSFRVEHINWISNAPNFPTRVQTRVRYRSQAVSSTLVPADALSSVIVELDTPCPAVTPGQGAVFYREDEVLGGGWISIRD